MTDKTKNGGIAAIGAFVFVAVVWGVNLWVGLAHDVVERGVLGDMFGAGNALFSGLAFVGVIYAVFLQRAEVQAAREEIANSKTMLLEQQGHLETQNLQSKKQMFDATFFQLLDLARTLRGGVQVRGPMGVRGEPDLAFKALTEIIDQFNFTTGAAVSQEHPLGAFYLAKVQPVSGSTLGPYFRAIYTILRRVRSADFLAEDEKVFYGNLIRSQLTDDEIFVMAANGMSSISGDFRDYLIEFRMLKYLPAKHKLLLTSSGSEFGPAYPQDAFQGR